MSEEKEFVWWADKLAKGRDEDRFDAPLDDDTMISWGDLMHAIENLSWFVEHESPQIRRGAEWALRHVVRDIKVRAVSGTLRKVDPKD